jgi:hypothetical protein
VYCLIKEQDFLKKPLAVIVFFIASSVVPVFAEISSVGFGANFDFDYTSITARDANSDGTTSQQSYSVFGYGFKTFIDFKYVEGSIGFMGLFTIVTSSEKLNQITGVDHDNVKLNGGAVTVSVLGKYPFELSSFILYPVLGIDGRIVVAQSYSEDPEPSWDGKLKGDSYQGNAIDWSALTIRFGLGIDYYLSSSLFLRSQLIFGVKLNTNREATLVKNIETNEDFANPFSIGGGGKITVSIGYTIDGDGRKSSGSIKGIEGRSNIFYPR